VARGAAVRVRLSVRERMCVSVCVYERACGVREREKEGDRECKIVFLTVKWNN
jgi:hypothetical protein